MIKLIVEVMIDEKQLSIESVTINGKSFKRELTPNGCLYEIAYTEIEGVSYHPDQITIEEVHL